jgi:hypothetical protein
MPLDADDIAEIINLGHEYTQPVDRYDQLYATFASLYPALRDAMHALARRPRPMR